MTGFLSGIGQSIYSWVYGSPDLFEIAATSENLKQAIKEKGKDVLQYKFNVMRDVYSPLEYAIKIRETESARTLISFQADVEVSTRSSGTMLHFYMDCLEENIPPDLELLTLLLDTISDVNKLDTTFCTSLERALLNMLHYKSIHWDVIEFLYKKGIKISNETQSIPFMILRDSHQHKIKNGEMVRSAEEEEIFLNHLITYLELERKYHPDSYSALTFEEFKFHTTHIHKEVFLHRPVSMLGSHVTTQKFEHEEKACQREFEIISKYHSIFEKLVKKGMFKDCFGSGYFKDMIAGMEKYDSLEPQLILLTNWGLTENK